MTLVKLFYNQGEGEPIGKGFVQGYYVDATNGNDSYPGTSPNKPWKTIAKVSAASFNPGDSILFKRGEVWRETWTVNTGGAVGRDVNYGAYGTGDKPRITGCDLVTGWTVHSGNVYKATFVNSIDIYLLIEDGTSIATLVGSIGAVDAAGKFFFDDGANLVYYWATDDADPDTHTMEIGARYDAVSCDDRQYITFDNLHFHGAGGQYGRGFGLKPTWLSPSNITLTNCRISHSWQAGVVLSHIDTWTPVDSFKMYDCEVDNNCQFGIYLFGDAASYRFTNILFDGCHIHHNGIDTTSGQFGVFSNWTDGMIVTGCELNDNQGQFDWSGNLYIGNGINTEVSYNISYNGNKNNIHLDTNCEGSIVKYNISYGATWNGIWFEDHLQSNGTSEIYNNTIYDCLHGIVFGPGGGAINEVSGITVKNNILDGCRRACVELNEDGASPDYLNNTWNTNVYLADVSDPAYEGQFRAEASRVNKTFAEWKTYISDDANSFNESADMVDPDNQVFALQSVSPARDAGTNVGLLIDYAGISVPQETNPAIGAYEYVS